MKKITEEFKNEMIKAIDNSHSMSEASFIMGLHNNTFTKYAKLFDIYKPNQGLKGKRGKRGGTKLIDLLEILDGKHPNYPTGKLKWKLIKAGLKENKCEECGICEWNNKPIVCHLDHKDGNRFNHSLLNLKLLCPNCHSQTDTYCGRNKNKFVDIDKRIKIINSEIKYKTNNIILKYGSQKIYHEAVKNNYKKSQEKYIDLILNSSIDFSKFGWVNKVAVIIKQKPQKVNAWMNKIMPAFYQEKCFKKKKTLAL